MRVINNTQMSTDRLLVLYAKEIYSVIHLNIERE